MPCWWPEQLHVVPGRKGDEGVGHLPHLPGPVAHWEMGGNSPASRQPSATTTPELDTQRYGTGRSARRPGLTNSIHYIGQALQFSLFIFRFQNYFSHMCGSVFKIIVVLTDLWVGNILKYLFIFDYWIPEYQYPFKHQCNLSVATFPNFQRVKAYREIAL